MALVKQIVQKACASLPLPFDAGNGLPRLAVGFKAHRFRHGHRRQTARPWEPAL